MLQFLEDLKGTGTPPISAHEREELEKLRKEHARLKDKLKDESQNETKKKKKSDESDDESDDSSEVN